MAAHRLAVWGVVAATLVLHSAALVLGSSARAGLQPIVFHDPLAYVGGALIGVAYVSVFAILAMRRPDNRVGWIFGGVALVSGLSNVSWAYVTNATETLPSRLPAPELAAWADSVSAPVWAFLLTVLVLLFPTGRALSRSWEPWLRLSAAVMVLGVLGTGFGAGTLPRIAVPNPFALPGTAGDLLGLLSRLWAVLVAGLIAVGVWSLLVRYRDTDEAGRLQLKWFAYAAVIFGLVGTAFLVVQETAFRAGSASGDVVWLAFCASATLIPIAALIAILRHDLYQIDTIIGRTFVYAGLTAILAGLYAASIRLFTWLFVEFTGESSDAALVLTTLVLATTFTPIKSRLEKVAATRWGDEDDKAATAVQLDDDQLRALADRVASLVRDQLESESRSRRRRPASAGGSAGPASASGPASTRPASASPADPAGHG